MGEIMYLKCRIKDGVDEQVCWLPEKSATAGAAVKIEGKGWYIVEVGDKKLTESNLEKLNKEYKFYNL